MPDANERHPREPAASQDVLICLALVLLSLLVYANSLCTIVPPGKIHGFVYDDAVLVVNEPAIRSLSCGNVVRIFTSPITGTYRPIRVLSYAVDFFLWGLNPIGYHLTNVLLHAANGILVYLILRLLVRERRWAVLAAALFVVHPVAVESVAAISGRKDLLGTLFVLCSFGLYVKATRSERPIYSYVLSLFLFLLALLTKEVMVILLPILAAYELCFAKEGWFLKIIRRQIPMAAIAVIFLLIWHSISQGRGRIEEHYGLAFAVKGLGLYLRLMFLPVGLNIDYHWLSIPERFLDRGVILSLTAVLFLGIVALLSLRKMSWLAFAIIWFFISLLPVSNLIIPIGAKLSERYLYVASVGWCIAVGGLLTRLINARPLTRYIGTSLAAILIVVLAMGAAHRNCVWLNSRTLAEDTIKKAPKSWSAQKGYGEIYLLYLKKYPLWWNFSLPHFRNSAVRSPHALASLAEIEMYLGNWANAEKLAEAHTRRQPEEAPVWAHLGEIYARQGKYSKAIDCYRKTVELSPWDAAFRRDLGRIYLSANRPDAALEELNKAQKAAPLLEGILADIGTAYLAKGLYKEAVSFLTKARLREPSNEKIVHNLACAYEQTGDLGSALAVYEEMMAQSPGSEGFLAPRKRFIELRLELKNSGPSAELLQQLGVVAAAIKRPDDAIQYLKQAESLSPNSAKIQCRLAAVYHTAGNAEEAEEHLKKAIALDPNEPLAWFGLAAINAERKENDEAIHNLRKAIDLGGSSFKGAARSHPAFQSLIGDEQFKKMIEENDQKKAPS